MSEFWSDVSTRPRKACLFGGEMFRTFVKSTVLVLSLVTSLQSLAQSQFPTAPDEQLTPGELCAHPQSLRYSEQINYCGRDVDSSLKKEIIADYDENRGYRIALMSRKKFKIDHYIPLCMGGSNSKRNLWPQHESVYQKTDPLEGLACDKMASGRLTQAEAVELIRKVKNDLKSAPEALRWLRRL